MLQKRPIKETLFRKRALLKRRYSTKETYGFIDPTNRSHPISSMLCSFLEQRRDHLCILMSFVEMTSEYTNDLSSRVSFIGLFCKKRPMSFVETSLIICIF